MVWGGFCGSIKSDLAFIPGKATLDSAAYVTTVMEPHLVPLWHSCCKEYGWAVVVGARQEVPRAEWNGRAPWPAQSPDLNLTEAL